MALINNNADEIFLLQSLHNQGIGSGGGGGGDIGNFISVGRDPNSFPGFYSIAMGENTIAAGEGSAAIGDECKSFGNKSGFTNGYNNVGLMSEYKSENYSGYYSGVAPVIFGSNNVGFSGSNSNTFINGYNNSAFRPLRSNESITVGTNLFYGYFDDASHILYSDKEKTQIVEYTVPASGAYIVDYNAKINPTTLREESIPCVFYTPDGITYNQITSDNDKGTFITGYGNKICGGIYSGGGFEILGSSNLIDGGKTTTNRNSLGSIGTGAFVAGTSNNLYYDLEGGYSSYGGLTAVIGYNNNLFELGAKSGNYKLTYVFGGANKVSKGEDTYIFGAGNIAVSPQSYSGGIIHIFGNDNNFKPYNGTSNQGAYSTYCVGRSNNIPTDTSINNLYIFGGENKLTPIAKLDRDQWGEVTKLIKNNNQYYSVSYVLNESTHKWEEQISSSPAYLSTSNAYLYNNKIYKALDNSTLSSVALSDTYRSSNATNYKYQDCFIGNRNLIGGYCSDTSIIGVSNKLVTTSNQVNIFGYSNSVYHGQHITTIGDNNSTKGYYLNIIGADNLSDGFSQDVIGQNNFIGKPGLFTSSPAVTPPSGSNTIEGAYDRRNNKFYVKTSQYDDDVNVKDDFTLAYPYRGDSYYEDATETTPIDGQIYKNSSSYSASGKNEYYQYDAELDVFKPLTTMNSGNTNIPRFNSIFGQNNYIGNGIANTIVGKTNTINNNNANYNMIFGTYNKIIGNTSTEFLTIEGVGNTGSGSYGHVEGYRNEVHGDAAHAEGYHTIASGDYQHVSGKYNVEDTNDDYALIIGGGADDTHRANILTLDWDGNLSIAGNFSFNVPTPVNPGDIMTKGVTDGYITDAYDPTATYDVGDYCIYNNTLYKCASAIAVAEPWTAAHWTATDIATELAAIKALAQQLPWTDFNQTLTAGQTTITITDAAITATSAIDVYTNAFGVEPINMALAAGSVTLTFEAQASDINVKVRVS